jgi:colanic acid/amylovoran biosynthesis glycosyltransferase
MARADGLRLLVVGVAWPPETFIAHLLQGLAQSGIEVTLATGRKPSDEWLQDAKIYWLHIPAWEQPVIPRMAQLAAQAGGAMLRSLRDARVFARAARPAATQGQRLAGWNRLLPYAGRRWDVIYFPWNSAAIEHLPLFELGMPVVISCRGSQIYVAPHNPEREPFHRGLRESFARAAVVHGVSKAIVQEAVQYGLDPARARVIYPAVDPDFFCPVVPRGPGRQDFSIVTTGSLVWVKGYEYACAAIRRLKDRGVPARLEIIGDGPEQQRLLYTIYDLGLEGSVQLAGRLSPPAVRQRLQAADVFLLSSLSEGLSNAALEAMACELPVVTTDCGGMREAITAGVEGLITPVRDAEALAEALEWLWRYPDMRLRMGQAGRRRVLRDFSLQDQTAQFVELFAAL